MDVQNRQSWVLPLVTVAFLILTGLGNAQQGSQPVHVDAQVDAKNLGREVFTRVWIADIPGQQTEFDGLGPLFNARSCLECHRSGTNNRQIPVESIAPHGLVANPDFWPTAVGSMLQDRGVLFNTPEVFVSHGNVQRIDPVTEESTSLHSDAFSRRLPPSLATVPLIQRVSGDDILAAQARSTLGGKISRLANGAIGRYGWKATHETLEDQIIAAFADDMGLELHELRPAHITSIAVFLEQSTTEPPLNAPTALTPPPTAFYEAGCADCHQPNNGLFSDLLLYNMGHELADPIGFGSTRNYWRTAPLFDLADAFRSAAFLHDGRATTLSDAILAHGGAAAAARSAWFDLPQSERQKIMCWLARDKSQGC